ncbi:MAG: hypothetical protein MJK12_18060 [Colwellia sp.]|nr:hypothetical protein [Colwellia sp.]
MSNLMKVTLIGSMFLLSGCSSNHHLVFFTNTTIGVEIASEPASGSPAKFIIGYKRQEGVIDPLIPDYEFIPNDTKANGGVPGGTTLAALAEPANGDTSIIMTPQGTAIPKGQNNKAHSVLAKMNFGATGGGSGASASQFFATGLAAEYLAKSKGITGALAGDPEINKVQKYVNLESNDNLATYAQIQGMYKLINKYPTDGDKAGEALTLTKNLDALDEGIFKKSFTHYTVKPASKDVGIVTYLIKNGNSFSDVISYITAMEQSLENAKKVVIDSSSTHGRVLLTSKQKQEMINDIAFFPSKIKESKDKISSNKAVVSMIDFVYKNILLKEKTK